MKIVSIILLVLAGCALGSFYYKWNAKRDEKRVAEIMACRGEEKKYRVKYRPVWKDSDEDSDTVITFELMAADAQDAEFSAYSFFDTRSRSLSFDALEVTELGKEG